MTNNRYTNQSLNPYISMSIIRSCVSNIFGIIAGMLIATLAKSYGWNPAGMIGVGIFLCIMIAIVIRGKTWY